MAFAPPQLLAEQVLFDWEVISTDTHQLENNKRYIVDNANLCMLTLPVTSAEGDLIRIDGRSSNGWEVVQNASQQIFLGSVSTVVGAGSGIASTSAHDCVTLLCIEADLEYNVINTSPNTTISTFVPFPLPDLLWLDAALGVTESGGAVSAWADQSGAGNDFTQASAPNRPTLVAGAVNGLPVIRFVAASNQSLNAALIVLPDAAQTIFFVSKASTVHDGFVLSTSNGGSGFVIRYRDNTTVLEMRFYNGTASVDGVDTDPTGFNVFCIKVLGTTVVAGLNSVYENGTLLASSSTVTTAHINPLKIGELFGGGFPFNGDIGEIMIYTTGLSDADRGDVENYLTVKYGL